MFREFTVDVVIIVITVIVNFIYFFSEVGAMIEIETRGVQT
jgi:hypothetical protein